MERKENLYEPVLDFRKQNPKMQIKKVNNDELYEKAFLKGEEYGISEYGMNNSAWD